MDYLSQEFLTAIKSTIFKGVPLTAGQKLLSDTARAIHKEYPTDGKYILDTRNASGGLSEFFI